MKNILVVGKYNSNSSVNSSNVDFLKNILLFFKGFNLNIFCDDVELCNQGFANLITSEINFDMIFVIGGDGTMMGAIRNYSQYNIPICGINLGRVGFLTDIDKNHAYEIISQILKDDYSIEKRDLLCVEVWKKDNLVEEQMAVNEIVIGRGVGGKLKQFSVFIDKEFAFNQYADGLIVATPTGSTAYALAAGGSIINPNSKIFNIVPICPQNLSNRPIIISNDSEIKIITNGDNNIVYSVDGIEPKLLEETSIVIVKKHKCYTQLVHPKNYSFYNGLRNKLGWNN